MTTENSGLLGGVLGGTPREQYEQAQLQAMLVAYNARSAVSQSERKPTPPTRYSSYTVRVEETSNGEIVRVGDVCRLCPVGEDLAATIVAAIAEFRLGDS